MTQPADFSPLRWDYPAKPQGEMSKLVPAEYFFGLARALGGHYPLGGNGLCHPGIHFDIGSASIARTNEVFAMADGEVIAYRLEKEPLTTRYPDRLAVYDSSFVLIRHKLEMPPIPKPPAPPESAAPATPDTPASSNVATPVAEGVASSSPAGSSPAPVVEGAEAVEEPSPSITLYSLYMHVAAWQTYEKDKAIVWPPYIDTVHRVKSELTDSLCGMRMITKPKGTEIAIIPKGCTVVLGDKIGNNYSKVVAITPASAVPGWSPGMEACVYHSELDPTGMVSSKANDVSNPARIKILYVYKNNFKKKSDIIANLPANAELVLGERSDKDKDLYKIINVMNLQGYPELPKNNEKIEGWVDIQRLETKPYVPPAGVKVIADKPYPVKAGQYIGQFGLYQNHNQHIPQRQIHVELFATEDLKAFIEKCRAKADKLEDKYKTIVRIPKGTLLAPQLYMMIMSSQNPPRSGTGTPIQTDLYFSKSSLNALSSSCKIRVVQPANRRENREAKTVNWYLLTNIATTEAGMVMDGWVSDESFEMVNPWSFPGFEFIEDDAQPIDLLAYQLSLTNKIRGAEAEKHKDKIEKGASSALITTLLGMLKKNVIKDLNVGGVLSTKLFDDGLKMFWYSQQTASLVLKTQTQWKKDIAPYKAMEPVLKASEEIANPVWEKELERMQKLAFWEDVNGVVGGADGSLWFLNPVNMASMMIGKSCMQIKDAQFFALKITTGFEGGKELDFGALGTDFDGQGMSFGLIQWNFGQGTLGPLLIAMKNNNSEAFKACFPAGTNFSDLEQALNSGSTSSQMAWARRIQRDSPALWKQSFANIAKIEAFNDIQLAFAAKYHPKVIAIIDFMRDLKPDLMVHVEVITYVALYDLCVQQETITSAANQIKARVLAEKPTTQMALVTIVVQERANTANTLWRADCFSRRMGILTRRVHEVTILGRTAKKPNGNYHLLNEYIGVMVCDL